LLRMVLRQPLRAVVPWYITFTRELAQRILALLSPSIVAAAIDMDQCVQQSGPSTGAQSNASIHLSLHEDPNVPFRRALWGKCSNTRGHEPRLPTETTLALFLVPPMLAPERQLRGVVNVIIAFVIVAMAIGPHSTPIAAAVLPTLAPPALARCSTLHRRNYA
jgi:hypothetical protein